MLANRAVRTFRPGRRSATDSFSKQVIRELSAPSFFLCFFRHSFSVLEYLGSIGGIVWVMLFLPLVDGSVRSGLREKQGKVRTSAFLFCFSVRRLRGRGGEFLDPG